MGYWKTGIVVALLSFFHLSSAVNALNPSKVAEVLPVKRESVSGQVLDQKGQPVSKAQIVVTSLQGDTISTAETDAQGRFALQLPPNLLKGEVLARVVISHGEFGVTGGPLKKGANEFRFGPMQTLRGQTLDSAGKPVAGVAVCLKMWRKTGGSYVFLERLGQKHKVMQQYTARSDAQGRWELPRVPVGEHVIIGAEDEKFVRSVYVIAEEATEKDRQNIVLRVRPGAVLEGRVLGENKKPVVGVRVFAQTAGESASQDGAWADAVTGTNGRFRLSGLADGSFNVMTDVKTGQTLLVKSVEVQAREGASTQIADLVLQRPVFVTGIVTSEGAPVAGTRISVYGPHRPKSTGAIASATTDEKGRYSLAVLPGRNQVFLSGLPKGIFVSRGESHFLDVQRDSKPVLNFKLEKMQPLKGVAVDETGKPLAKITIRVPGRFYEEKTAQTDAQGNWTLEELEPGKIKLWADGEWEIVGNSEIQLPHRESVKLVVRHTPQEKLVARVLDTDGKPVADATVTAQVYTSYGNTGRVRDVAAKSGADGTFRLEGLGRNDSVYALRAAKDGYVFLGNPQLAEIGQRAPLRDIVLTPAAESVNGRVLDTNGKPVEGAVILLLNTIEETTSDAQGRFTVKNVPASGEILALTSRGAATAKAAPNLELKIAPFVAIPERDAEAAYRVLKALWQESEGKDFYSRRYLSAMLEPLDAKRAAEFRNDQNQSDSILSILFSPIPTSRPPAPLAQRLNEVSPITLRAHAASFLGLKVAAQNPELAEKLLAQTGELLKKQGLTPDAGDEYGLVMSYAMSAALAGRLGKTREANTFYDFGLTVAERFFKEGVRENNRPSLSEVKGVFAGALAMGDVALANRLFAELPAAEQNRAISEAVRQAVLVNPIAAQELLQQILKTKTPLPSQQTSGRSDPDSEYGRSALAVIEALVSPSGDKSLEAAPLLKIARGIVSPYHRAFALALVAQHLPNDADEVFQEAYRAAQDANRVGRFDNAPPRVAALAFQKNPALGRTLFNELWSSWQKGQASIPKGSLPSNRELANLAFFMAPVMPEKSRHMLERAWTRSREAGITDTQSLVLAMCACDPKRAEEMAAQLSERERFDAQRKIAQYLLLDNHTRQTLDFSRWQASDTWTPGTPTGW